MRTQIAFVFLSAIVVCSILRADEPATTPAAQGLVPIPDYTGDLWHRSYLAGDFNGGRTALANKGIQLDVDWTQVGQSVTSGGLDSASHYGGSFDYLIHLDLMRMGLLPGALITIRAESRYGQSVNGQAGSILPVNTDALFPVTDQLDDGIALTVTDLNYTQFLSDKFAVLLGKIDTLSGDPNEFAAGRGTSQFMNANFIFNSVTALRLPYSTLGAGILWLPSKNITVTSSVFNTIDSSTTTGFDDFGGGTTWSTEADMQYRLGNLPGGMNVGGLYSFDQDFTKLTGDLIFVPGQGLALTKKHDTWAVYWSAWQYLFVKDPNDKPIETGDGMPDHQGIGLFARAGFADQDTDPVKWSASGGIGGRGMIPSRDNDTFGAGYYYTRIQQNRLTTNGLFGIDDNAQGLEGYYNIALTPAAHLTFDLQWLKSSVERIEDGVILGVRLDLKF